MDLTHVFKKVSEASRSLRITGEDRITVTLLKLADNITGSAEYIIRENKNDLERMDKSDPRYDRLILTAERIDAIAGGIRDVANLPDPGGKILYENVRPNGLTVSRISVPFGVVGIIFEARPNVVLDVFALCLKSRNASILKGGTDAQFSNEALMGIIKRTLKESGIDENITALLPPGREETVQLLNAREWVDIVIPRGSRSLIDFVRNNSSVPVIETGAGICHTYFDVHGDKEKGRSIIYNAKTRRVSVCNALDCLVIHKDRLTDLPYLVGKCADSDVIIYADIDAFRALSGKYPEKLLQKADESSFGTEFLSYRMAVKTVNDIDEALLHIEKYGSKHSEAIISEDALITERFLKLVDASSVYSNASTAFTDGAEFGLGAEIGISTQKLHARGPMGLQELTTYKWIIKGNGQVRN